jgi:hypothetical protein
VVAQPASRFLKASAPRVAFLAADVRFSTVFGQLVPPPHPFKEMTRGETVCSTPCLTRTTSGRSREIAMEVRQCPEAIKRCRTTTGFLVPGSWFLARCLDVGLDIQLHPTPAWPSCATPSNGNLLPMGGWSRSSSRSGPFLFSNFISTSTVPLGLAVVLLLLLTHTHTAAWELTEPQGSAPSRLPPHAIHMQRSRPSVRILLP